MQTGSGLSLCILLLSDVTHITLLDTGARVVCSLAIFNEVIMPIVELYLNRKYFVENYTAYSLSNVVYADAQKQKLNVTTEH